MQDSGVHDLSCASTEPSGASTPISSAEGASCHADCIFKLPTNENQLSELAEGSLSTYTCTSQNDESTLLPEPSLSDEANEKNAYDFSTRVNADSGEPFYFNHILILASFLWDTDKQCRTRYIRRGGFRNS